MNWRKIRIIAWKDILEVRQNKSVLISMVLVPLIIMVRGQHHWFSGRTKRSGYPDDV